MTVHWPCQFPKVPQLIITNLICLNHLSYSRATLMAVNAIISVRSQSLPLLGWKFNSKTLVAYLQSALNFLLRERTNDLLRLYAKRLIVLESNNKWGQIILNSPQLVVMMTRDLSCQQEVTDSLRMAVGNLNNLRITTRLARLPSYLLRQVTCSTILRRTSRTLMGPTMAMICTTKNRRRAKVE